LTTIASSCIYCTLCGRWPARCRLEVSFLGLTREKRSLNEVWAHNREHFLIFLVCFSRVCACLCRLFFCVCVCVQNVNDLNQWLSAIRKASIYNERMLPSFHPGAHRSGKWTCCLQAERSGTAVLFIAAIDRGVIVTYLFMPGFYQMCLFVYLSTYHLII